MSYQRKPRQDSSGDVHLYPVKHNREQAVPTVPILQHIHSLPPAGNTPCLQPPLMWQPSTCSSSMALLLQILPANVLHYGCRGAMLQSVEPEFKQRLWNWKFIVHATFASLFCWVLFSFSSPKQQQNTRTRCLRRTGVTVKALFLLCLFCWILEEWSCSCTSFWRNADQCLLC